jgi:hypothetical protein
MIDWKRAAQEAVVASSKPQLPFNSLLLHSDVLVIGLRILGRVVCLDQ